MEEYGEYSQKSFSFWVSYYDTARDLPDSERLAFYDSMLEYVFLDSDPEQGLKDGGNIGAYFAFKGCRPNLNTSKGRALSGSKPKSNRNQTRNKTKQNESNEKQNESNEKQNESNAKQIEIEIEEEKEDKEKKERHGTFGNVLLTPSEFSNLKSKVSKPQDLIEAMSSYLASSGKRYKSHYAALLNWARRDGLLVEGGAKPKGTAPHCKTCGGLLTRFPEGLFCGNCGFVEEEGADDEPSTARPDG